MAYDVKRNKRRCRWITVKGNHIPVKDGQTKEQAVKEFLENKVEKQSKRDKIKKRNRKEVKLPKAEYAKVMHELNTNLTNEQRQQKHIHKAVGNYFYTVINNGFNNYKIIDKEDINDIN